MRIFTMCRRKTSGDQIKKHEMGRICDTYIDEHRDMQGLSGET